MFVFPAWILGQNTTFEIYGNITGEYKNKIYVFFESRFSQKDSISALIKDGKFYLKEKAVLPILCRFHFGGKSNIQSIYIDSEKTSVNLLCTLSEKDIPDSLGGARTKFTIESVRGSKTQNIIDGFQVWERQSRQTPLSDARKASNYFAALQSLVIKYPTSKASAYLLAGGGFLIGSRFMLRGDVPLTYSQVNELKNLLDTSLKNTYEYQNLMGFVNSLEKEDKRMINSSFHNVMLKGTNGEEINTKYFAKKFLLIDFWASWCKPCRGQNVELKKLYQEYKNKNFEIIGVSLDEDKKAWKKAIIQDGLRWIQLNDENTFEGELAKYYDITTVPQKILVDNQNKIIGINLSVKEIENVLKQRIAN